MRMSAAHGIQRWTYEDGKEQFKGKASRAHTDISIVGTEEEGDEDHHIEAGQRSNPLRCPATYHTYDDPEFCCGTVADCWQGARPGWYMAVQSRKECNQTHPWSKDRHVQSDLYCRAAALRLCQ